MKVDENLLLRGGFAVTAHGHRGVVDEIDALRLRHRGVFDRRVREEFLHEREQFGGRVRHVFHELPRFVVEDRRRAIAQELRA